MRSTNPVSVSVLALALVLASAISASSQAGVHGFHGGSVAPRGVPASVTSFGFGGRPGFHGVPPSVTSLGFGANTVFPRVPPNPAFRMRAPFRVHNQPFVNRPFVGRGRRNGFGFGSPFFGGSVVVPFAYPVYVGDSAGYMDDPSYMDDPPVADSQAERSDDARRQLDSDYRAELNSERQEPQPASAEEPVTAQPSTVLVFKDGHQLEVGNYAIVGTTLYDLSEGRSKKVQLADLDLGATLKQNDQRGVEFQLPAGTNLD